MSASNLLSSEFITWLVLPLQIAFVIISFCLIRLLLSFTGRKNINKWLFMSVAYVIVFTLVGIFYYSSSGLAPSIMILLLMAFAAAIAAYLLFYIGLIGFIGYLIKLVVDMIRKKQKKYSLIGMGVMLVAFSLSFVIYDFENRFDPILKVSAAELLDASLTSSTASSSSAFTTNESAVRTTIGDLSSSEADGDSIGFGEQLSLIETEIDGKLICVLKYKIQPSYSNWATINQNYFTVEEFILAGNDIYDEIQYWAVADMTSGNESKVISFIVPSTVIQYIADRNLGATQLGDYVEDLWIMPSLIGNVSPQQAETPSAPESTSQEPNAPVSPSVTQPPAIEAPLVETAPTIEESSQKVETSNTNDIIVNNSGPYRRNEDATIAIMGAPNTLYGIRVRYPSGYSDATGLHNKTSDAYGYVYWTWRIGGNTSIGTHYAEIICEGMAEPEIIHFDVIESQ